MSSYAPTTLANAGSIMAPKMGLTWEDNRTEVIGYVNRYRNYLYNRYNERRLFDSVFQCFVPQRFRTLCRQCDPCASKFLGFTLPRFMAGVTGVWTHGIPLLQRSAWREHYTGRAPDNGAIYDVVEQREHFPTERDIQTPSQLWMFAASNQDEGKAAYVEVRDTDGREQKLRFDLQGDGWAKSEVFVEDIRSVVLPSNLKGAVTLATETGYELSAYSPTEIVPAYKRYALPAGCRTLALVQGTRPYVDLSFDNDVVEIGDRLVIEHFGKHFRYFESKDSTERQIATLELQSAFNHLDGLVSRDEGGKPPRPFASRLPRPRLPGYY